MDMTWYLLKDLLRRRWYVLALVTLVAAVPSVPEDMFALILHVHQWLILGLVLGGMLHVERQSGVMYSSGVLPVARGARARAYGAFLLAGAALWFAWRVYWRWAWGFPSLDISAVNAWILSGLLMLLIPAGALEDQRFGKPTFGAQAALVVALVTGGFWLVPMVLESWREISLLSWLLPLWLVLEPLAALPWGLAMLRESLRIGVPSKKEPLVRLNFNTPMYTQQKDFGRRSKFAHMGPKREACPQREALAATRRLMFRGYRWLPLKTFYELGLQGLITTAISFYALHSLCYKFDRQPPDMEFLGAHLFLAGVVLLVYGRWKPWLDSARAWRALPLPHQTVGRWFLVMPLITAGMLAPAVAAGALAARAIPHAAGYVIVLLLGLCMVLLLGVLRLRAKARRESETGIALVVLVVILWWITDSDDLIAGFPVACSAAICVAAAFMAWMLVRSFHPKRMNHRRRLPTWKVGAQ